MKSISIVDQGISRSYCVCKWANGFLSKVNEIREDFLKIVRRRLAGFDRQEVRLVAEALRALGKDAE